MDNSSLKKQEGMEESEEVPGGDSYCVTFSMRLVQWRHQYGWTQEELAIASGLSVRYIGDLERRGRNLTLRTLQKIVETFEVTLDVFWVADHMEVSPKVGAVKTNEVNLDTE